MDLLKITQNELTNVIFCNSNNVEKLKKELRQFFNSQTIAHFFILEKGIDCDGNLHNIIQGELLKNSDWYDYFIPIMKDIEAQKVPTIFANIWNIVDSPIILGVFISDENMPEKMGELRLHSANKYNVISYPQ